MHIAIDISPLQSGHSGRGVGVYTKLLIEALQQYEKDHVFSLITHQHDIPDTCSLVHYPYFDPFFLTLPHFRKYRSVVTVHDLIPLVYPDKFPSGIKGGIRWQFQKVSLRSVRRVITDSETSKKDITRIVGRNPSTIDVIYLAPSIQRQPSKISASEIRSRYTNGNPYVMYVGDVNWNKNIPGLIRAFALVHKESPSLHLVMVGKAFCDDTIRETKEIHELIQSEGVSSFVHTPGFVDTTALAALYSSAVALIQPSFYEGFGFPVVDALSLGCPVVSSSVASLSEISGPATQVDPLDTQLICSGILEAVTRSDAKRKEVIKKGLDWVSRFNWKRVAHETVESYKKAII